MRMLTYKAMLLAGVLSVAMVMMGCPPSEPEATEMPLFEEVADSAYTVELTDPQSDDRNNVLAVREPQALIVRGLISGPEPVDTVEVNGVSATVYPVEEATIYGQQTEDTIYRFHAPAVLQSDDEIIVVAAGQDFVFSPDTAATTDRWRTRSREDPGLSQQLGRVYYRDQMYDDSITVGGRAIEHEESPWLFHDLGMTYLRAGQHEDAIASLDRAEQLYADMPDLYFARGLTYLEMEQHNEAIAEFGQAADLAPDWAEPYFMRGQAYRAQQMHADAEADFEQAMDIWPEWASPYYALALVRIDQDRVDEAVQLADQGEQRGPCTAETHQELAQRFHDAAREDAARRHIELADMLGAERQEWWGDVEDATPEYEEHRDWPWEARATDGYRIAEDHPWYAADRQ